MGAAEMESAFWKEYRVNFNSIADVLLLSFYCCFLAYILNILFYDTNTSQ